MKTQTSLTQKRPRKFAVLALTLAALGLGFGSAHAAATNPADLNIKVTVSAAESVIINGSGSTSTTTVWSAGTPNSASASTATVTNNASGITERWELSTVSQSSGVNSGNSSDGWTNANSTATTLGLDQFAIQSVFGSSNTVASGCPNVSSTDWNQSFAPALTTTPLTYASVVSSTAAFADTSLNANGAYNPDCTNGSASGCNNDGDMFVNDSRALCWRLLGPSSVSASDDQNLKIIVTANVP